jgi:hypothetical protein
MHEPISWEDWKAGRAQRRKTGMRVAPEVIRRDKSSSDARLKRLFNGERGLPFTKDGARKVIARARRNSGID